MAKLVRGNVTKALTLRTHNESNIISGSQPFTVRTLKLNGIKTHLPSIIFNGFFIKIHFNDENSAHPMEFLTYPRLRTTGIECDGNTQRDI